MSIAKLKKAWVVVDVDGTLPGHLELPQDNGEFVDDWLQFPQSILLTDVLLPRMNRIRPDDQYMIGGDLGIYWRLAELLERGVIVPDWMYVAGVPRSSDERIRRSYVLWKEKVAPEIVMEFTMHDGSFERDRTPLEGKFWIYEQAVQARYYVLFVVPTAELEVHRLENGVYRRLTPNSRGRYPITSLTLELGVWRGRFMNEDAPWIRWYSPRGRMLLLGNEQAEAERSRALASRLKELGVDPTDV